MNDFIQSLQIALSFVPEKHKRLPGGPALDVILFDFSGSNSVELYASDGHMMVRLKLAVVETAGSGSFFIDGPDARKLVKRFQIAKEISLAVWGDDMMITADGEVITIHRAAHGFGDRYREFFELRPPESRAILDSAKLRSAVLACLPVMASYKETGPAFDIRLQARDDEGEYPTALIYPRLIPGMENLQSIEIVLMGLKL